MLPMLLAMVHQEISLHQFLAKSTTILEGRCTIALVYLLCKHLKGHLVQSVLNRGAVHPLCGGTIELADDGCFGSLISLVVVINMTTVPAGPNQLNTTVSLQSW